MPLFLYIVTVSFLIYPNVYTILKSNLNNNMDQMHI